MLERCLVDFVNIICKEGSLNLNPRPQIKIEITDDVDEKDVIAEQRYGHVRKTYRFVVYCR